MITCEGARWVGPQAAAITSQTRPPDEVVVADDASTDDTVARAVAALAPLGDRVRVLESDRRLGLTPNFERAARAATGDIIVFADQDDVWLPRRLAAVEEWAAASPSAGCFADGWIIDGDGRRTGEHLWDRAGFGPGARSRWERDALGVLLRQPVVTGATLAVRRAALELVLPIPAVGWHDYAVSLLLAATSGLTALDDALIEYRLHGDNVAGLPATRRRDRVQSPDARRVNLREQIAMFEALRERLEARGHGVAAARFAGKTTTLRRRAQLPAARPARAPGVAGLLLRGDYRRYGQGWASAARDLLWP